MRHTPSTLQTASLRWLAFAYENQEVSRLASYLRRRRTGLGRVLGTGTSRWSQPPAKWLRVHYHRSGDRSCSSARCCSHIGRLKYSMASRSRLGMQISSDESHVSAPGLILYPAPLVPPLLLPLSRVRAFYPPIWRVSRWF